MPPHLTASDRSILARLLRQAECSCEGAEDEGEGSYMSAQALQAMQSHAADLLAQVDDSTELPDWVEAKITGAAQDLQDVYEFMMHGYGQRLASKTAGWDGVTLNVSKQGFIEHILNYEYPSGSVVDYKSTRTALYVLHKHRGHKTIDVVLIEGRPGDWRSKTMNESAGPYYYDCPPALLAKADPATNEQAQNWRNAVLERAGIKKDEAAKSKGLSASIKVGSDVEIHNNWYTVLRMEPRGVIIVLDEATRKQYSSNVKKVTAVK